MNNQLKYLATVNGITIGMFNDISEGRIACERAIATGIAGYDMHVRKIIEIRDTTNAYNVVARF